MKLGANSRYLLELLAMLGGDALDSLVRMPGYYQLINCSSESNFWRRANALASKGYLEAGDEYASGKWVGKLTQSGGSTINEDIDPLAEWGSPWDGHWRLFAFDLPKDRGTERQTLRQWLKRKRLGKLQGSLWITPKDLGDWMGDLAKRKVDPSAVFLIKGAFEGPTDPLDYVNTAWSFKRINEAYDRYLNFLENESVSSVAADRFPEWFHQEVYLWRKAFEEDPFLPKELCPNSTSSPYLGPDALESRKQAYNLLKERILS